MQYNIHKSGRSAVWLAHQHGGLGVGGSSPLAPTLKDSAVVVPAFNEELNIKPLIKRILRIVPKDNLLVINDCSTDKTEQIVKGMEVKIIDNAYAHGKGNAIKTGLSYAMHEKFKYIIIMDADLQHPPEYLTQIAAKLENGADIVIGSRWLELKNMPSDRYISNRLTSFFVSMLLCRRIEDTQSGFRGYNSGILSNISLTTSHFETETELLIKAILRKPDLIIDYVHIPAIYHDTDFSKIKRTTDTLRFIKMYFTLLWKKN